MAKINLSVTISNEARTYAKLLKINCSELLEKAIMVRVGNEGDNRELQELYKAKNFIEQEMERISLEKSEILSKITKKELEGEKEEKEKEEMLNKKYDWMKENILHRVGGR